MISNYQELNWRIVAVKMNKNLVWFQMKLIKYKL